MAEERPHDYLSGIGLWNTIKAKVILNMTTITIHDVPDELKAAFELSAAADGLSLDAYVRELLAQAYAERNRGRMNLADATRLYFGPENGVDLDLSGRDSDRDLLEFDEFDA